MARKAAAQVDETAKPPEPAEPITEEVVVEVNESQEAPETTVVDTGPAVEAPATQESSEAPTPPREDSEKVALRQRLQEMENAVVLERQQREIQQRHLLDAQRNARQSNQQAWRDRYDTVTNTMGAAQSVIDSGLQELETLWAENRFKEAAEVQRKINKAETSLAQAESIKQQMDDQLEQWRRRQQQPQPRQQPRQQQPQPQPRQQQQSPEQIIAGSGLPERAQRWLREHVDYITDPAKNATIIALHDTAKRQAGGSEWTDGYFDKMEELLGLNAAPRPSGSGNGAAQPSSVRTAQVSAPPTREAPSMSTGRTQQSTKVTLSPAQREIASSITGKNADGSDYTQAQKEQIYARNLQKLNKLKTDGGTQ